MCYESRTVIVREHTRASPALCDPAPQPRGPAHSADGSHACERRCRPWQLTAAILSSPAPGEGPHALPQAAERTDRPGLPQTQTGEKLSPMPYVTWSSLC